MTLVKSFTFDASHALTTFPPGHKCRNLHGHTWTVEVHCAGEVDMTRGYLIDYGEIKRAVSPLIDRLDHHHLNDIEGLEISTSEIMCQWLWERLKPELASLSKVVVYETPTSRCEYEGR
ncbi:MAG: 6-carboxytetrahydropterin synthase QueD [Phycisphaerae bacterium]